MDVIQSELHRAALEWNAPRIRPSSNVESPSEKPDVLYFIPASAESQNYMAPVDIDEIEIAKDTCAEQPQVSGCCPYFKNLCELIMEDEGREPATTAEEALQLYVDLLDHINALP